MVRWTKHADPHQKYGAKYTWGDRNIELPEQAIISVTRGENFSLVKLMINGVINEFVKKQLIRNQKLLYAELTGQLEGGIGQTVTVWRSGTDMNHFRTNGAHKFAKRFFSWVFYSGGVQAYFLTWKITGCIPDEQEIEHMIRTYGRHFDGGRLVRPTGQPPDSK
ncbi:hypothetical protein [Paenibacillus pinihumi]|uniref:hypothetical protein n=1 Tax=Paenibacillus pinihumi TaxID=669462 RepID=UPI0004903226|nr:hypothetical protein [Paenibacillus pinihumi]